MNFQLWTSMESQYTSSRPTLSLLTFITLLESILIFVFLNTELKQRGNKSKVTRVCPGIQQWCRQRPPSLALLELQTNLTAVWSLRMCSELCCSLPSSQPLHHQTLQSLSRGGRTVKGVSTNVRPCEGASGLVYVLPRSCQI